MGMLEPVQFSEWATPVVLILKGNGSNKTMWSLQGYS